jgi:hypothetical protein
MRGVRSEPMRLSLNCATSIPSDDGRRAWRTEPPEQSPDVVIAGRGRHRRKFEFGGKGGLKRCNGVFVMPLPDIHRDGAAFRELVRVAHKIEQRLPQPHLVGMQGSRQFVE